MSSFFDCLLCCFNDPISRADHYRVRGAVNPAITATSVITSSSSSSTKIVNPFTKISDNALFVISSYFSIFDAIAMEKAAKNLKNRAEICIWRSLAITNGITLSGNKTAKETVRTEEYMAYHKFHLLAITGNKIISISNENNGIDIEKELARRSVDKHTYEVKLRTFKRWVEAHDHNRFEAVRLTINRKDLTRLPSNLSFPNLETIDLSHLILQHPIPGWIVRLPKLKRLSLTNMGLTTLPSRVLECTNLKTLDISNSENDMERANCIHELPAALCDSLRLTSLLIKNLNLISLPSVVCRLIHLESLSLDNNPSLGGLPRDISNLRNLSTLRISNIGLKEWPRELLELTKMRVLEINNNRLENLSAEFHDWLMQLSTLDAHNNPWSQSALDALQSIAKAKTDKEYRHIHYS